MGGGAPGGGAAEVALRVSADVDDLAEELGVVRVHGLGHAPEGRDAARVVADHALRPADAARVHADGLEDDEPDAAARLLGVVVDVPLARQVLDAVVGRVRGHEDAVLQLDAADPDGREHVREGASSYQTSSSQIRPTVDVDDLPGDVPSLR